MHEHLYADASCPLTSIMLYIVITKTATAAGAVLACLWPGCREKITQFANDISYFVSLNRVNLSHTCCSCITNVLVLVRGCYNTLLFIQVTLKAVDICGIHGYYQIYFLWFWHICQGCEHPTIPLGPQFIPDTSYGYYPNLKRIEIFSGIHMNIYKTSGSNIEVKCCRLCDDFWDLF